MRADRLVRMLALLQRHGRLTAPDLARRLEVSNRTILRDVEALSTAGVPIYTERGSSGGIRLMEGYSLDVSGIHGVELHTLLLGDRSALWNALGWTQEAAAAQVQLRRALPPAQVAEADLLSQHLLVDDRPWFAGAPPQPIVVPLLSAIRQKRQIASTYTRPDGTTVERCLSPYALVAKAGVWYLVAAREGDLRVYRADRIATLRVLDTPAERSATFDLPQFWADWTRAFEASRPRFVARLAVSPALYGPFLQSSAWPVVTIQEPFGDNPHYHVTMVFENIASAARHIVSFTPDVRVMEPVELADAVYRAALCIGSWAAGIRPATTNHVERPHPPSPGVSGDENA